MFIILFCATGPQDLRPWTTGRTCNPSLNTLLHVTPFWIDQPPVPSSPSGPISPHSCAIIMASRFLACQSSDESAHRTPSAPTDPVAATDSERTRVIREVVITRSCATSTRTWMTPPTEAPKAARRNGAGVANLAAVAAAAATASIAAMEAMVHHNECTPPSKARRPPASPPASAEKMPELPPWPAPSKVGYKRRHRRPLWLHRSRAPWSHVHRSQVHRSQICRSQVHRSQVQWSKVHGPASKPTPTMVRT